MNSAQWPTGVAQSMSNSAQWSLHGNSQAREL